MSSRCGIGLEDGYFLYYDVNDIVDGSPIDNPDYWVCMNPGDGNSFRVMPLSTWKKMILRDELKWKFEEK
ncbi:MAG: hypothetical protein V4493_08650 [Pseudomonadota bacterium]